jgi:hypothetical protein
LFLALFVLFYSLPILINYVLVSNEDLTEKKGKRILVLGDSNAACGINDTVYSVSTNLSAPSDSYFYSYLKLKKAVRSGMEFDTLLLSFAPHNIFDNPWFTKDDIIYTQFRKYYPLMDFEDLINLTRQNPESVLGATKPIGTECAKNVLLKAKGDKFLSLGGFEHMTLNSLDLALEKLSKDEPIPFCRMPKNHELTQNELFYLQKIVEYCAKHDKKLVFINVPKRKELLSYKLYGFDDFYAYYFKEYGQIDFLDFHDLILPERYFGDLTHLNLEGSSYFSELLQTKGIKNLLKEYNRRNRDIAGNHN